VTGSFFAVSSYDFPRNYCARKVRQNRGFGGPRLEESGQRPRDDPRLHRQHVQLPTIESGLFNALQQGGITVLDVRSPNPSNIVYAKIKPRGSDHIKQALANMLNGSKHGPLKVAMVFDNDVDIWVAQCMAFRYIPDRDTCNATSTDPQIGDVDRRASNR
jgi:3-polyprenyl-4-hydroxybenzoate decarboxylase